MKRNKKFNNYTIGLKIYSYVIVLIILTDSILRLSATNLLYGKNVSLYPLESLQLTIGDTYLLSNFFNSLFAVQSAPFLLLSLLIILCFWFLFSRQKFLLSSVIFLLKITLDIRNHFFLDGSDNVISVSLPFIILAFLPEILEWKYISKFRITLEKYLHQISRFAILGLKFQICLIYFSTALYKLQEATWKSGTAIYYAMRISEFNSTKWNILLTNSFLFVKLNTYFTLAWEFLFGFFIWFNKAKWFFILLGIGFHTGIYIFMRIEDFSWIMIGSYAVFISDKEYLQLYSRLKKRKLVIWYDNYCPNCQNFKNIIFKIDIHNNIKFLPLRTNSDHINYPLPDKSRSLSEMAAWNIKAKKHIYGFETLVSLCRVLPILYIFWLPMKLIHFFGCGNIIYKEFAINRKIIPIHCSDDCALPNVVSSISKTEKR